jgi:hypothetical protein
LDTDYLALSVLLGAFGIVGMTATAGIHPAPANCDCIPSPAMRFQELSVILFAFGVALAPVAVLKRGAGRAYSGGVMRSGGLFFLGVALVVLGVAVVAIPSFLVLQNTLLIAEGGGMVAFGVLLAYRGSRLY